MRTSWATSPGDGRGSARGWRRHGLGAAGVSPSRRPMAPSRHRNERTARRSRTPPRRVRRCLSSRDREAAQAQVQPLPGLTLAALTSSSRPSFDPVRMTRHSDRCGSPTTGSGTGKWLRFSSARRRPRGSRTSPRSSGYAGVGPDHGVLRASARIGLGGARGQARARLAWNWTFPSLVPCSAGCLDLRAALTAGSISPTDSGLNSKVSGRVGLIDSAALTGETELGLTGRDGQVLRGLRVTTEMPVVPATRLQLSYAYRTGAQFPLGQVFEMRILRRAPSGLVGEIRDSANAVARLVSGVMQAMTRPPIRIAVLAVGRTRDSGLRH